VRHAFKALDKEDVPKEWVAAWWALTKRRLFLPALIVGALLGVVLI